MQLILQTPSVTAALTYCDGGRALSGPSSAVVQGARAALPQHYSFPPFLKAECPGYGPLVLGARALLDRQYHLLHCGPHRSRGIRCLLKNTIALFSSETCRGLSKSTSHPQTMMSCLVSSILAYVYTVFT